ncbi:MAG: nickel-dependent hydrogenase large subunit, partial [Propionibacteriaceae bacterium]|nr:nickel-dependent hydrogenase large subunit [Propionibacteriaceae bacterium]
MTQHLQIDQIIDPSDATVIVQRDAAGRPLDAHFDMSGLPRVDTMMIGRPATEVPVLAERLCGICPVAHHLAGIQALEALSRPIALSSTAKAVRQLLNYGSVVDGHLLGFIGENLEAVKVLRRFARLVMGAAGSPKHFPTTAVPGGVTKTVDLMDLAVVIGALPIAQAAAEGLVQAHLDDESVGGVFTGADVALVGPNGQIDLMGGRLRAAAVDGSVIVEGALPEQWDDTIREAVPGSAAPRPYLVALGPQKGQYRTGPVAQLRVGRLSTPLAAAAQMRWLGGG